MKVKVTIENLENGAKDSAIGDGAMAYIKVGNNDHILALGKYDSMEAVSGLPMVPRTAHLKDIRKEQRECTRTLSVD